MKTLKHLEMFESDKVASWKAVYFAFINMSAKAKNLMEQTFELNEAENLLQEVRNYFVIRISTFIAVMSYVAFATNFEY